MADGAVGEDAEVLVGFAEVENQALGSWEVRGMEDWDVGAGGPGGEMGGLEVEGGEAGGEVGADAIWVMSSA